MRDTSSRTMTAYTPHYMIQIVKDMRVLIAPDAEKDFISPITVACPLIKIVSNSTIGVISVRHVLIICKLWVLVACENFNDLNIVLY